MCRKCSARMSFRKEPNNHLTLNSFFNHHVHTDASDHKAGIKLIRDFITDLPSDIQPTCAMKIAKKRFGITESKFFYHYRRVKETRVSIADLIDELNNLGYTVLTEPYHLLMTQLP